ncbi:hypothetical protein IFU23_05765 [Pantoea agglomerans]|uniref:Uncharacterized protein n=1 Tax=Enterobacter agglomerans TaxID=549 RepID=A0ACC5PV86_ENTAG|nr:hypothetical protein [Pantoea agglomerans]MBD8152274.1 hypothetical protein [Pantoea agglomerans]MBD8157613.1 hypothetical protein [Pantoea agglomerans]MBD8231452.1 hypothetical protein [Pantoea agglomerans]MBD8241855.1 hypothetical protein [Pantoea agglomerans]
MGFVDRGQTLLALVNIGDGGGLPSGQLAGLMGRIAPDYGFIVIVISSPTETSNH